MGSRREDAALLCRMFVREDDFILEYVMEGFMREGDDFVKEYRSGDESL